LLPFQLLSCTTPTPYRGTKAPELTTHDINVWANSGHLFNIYHDIKANQTINARVAIPERGSPYVFAIAYKNGVVKAEGYTIIEVKNGSVGAVILRMVKPGTARIPTGPKDPDDPQDPSDLSTPTLDDFDIRNLAQAAVDGSIQPVSITPKAGKSTGAITIYYQGTGGTTYARSTTLPTTAGTYTVTFNVAASTGWKAATGLSAGTLALVDPSNVFDNVDSSGKWNTAVSAINAAGLYLINITGDFSIAGLSGGNTNFSATGINIFINGNDKEISLSSIGNLICIGANQNVTINNLTLQGYNGNGYSLVFINYGTFTMNSGTIKGNTTDSSGGGVFVDGIFNMTGGTISGNTLTNSHTAGGGVNVYGGSFTMNGGTISGNNVKGLNGGGGGVWSFDSTFTMNNGTISGNYVTGDYGWGGGVCTYNYSTFTMNGGAISGNNVTGSNSVGGGMCVWDTFQITNGTIYGNNETDTALRNTAVNGGAALYVYSGSTAQYGSGSSWTDIPLNSGSTTSRDDTIRVVNGVLE